MNDTTVDTRSTTDLIISEKRNGVGYLGFNRPEKHNAISYEMWQGIAKVIADFETDDTVRAVVVSGEGGRAFSAGADISQFEKQRASADAIKEYSVASGLAHDTADEHLQANHRQDCGILHRRRVGNRALL